ncbi:unnamed protein product [Ambrosiozyma monospora]|uniref:Unnamed protein product n=1 Tax=Ambrosiozyma monospora TaxID=43982 RepID=A0A9W6Z6D8_AMBMO|nr:unnamed protein product [Ambrosiozyma monospora]
MSEDTPDTKDGDSKPSHQTTPSMSSLNSRDALSRKSSRIYAMAKKLDSQNEDKDIKLPTLHSPKTIDSKVQALTQKLGANLNTEKPTPRPGKLANNPFLQNEQQQNSPTKSPKSPKKSLQSPKKVRSPVKVQTPKSPQKPKTIESPKKTPFLESPKKIQTIESPKKSNEIPSLSNESVLPLNVSSSEQAQVETMKSIPTSTAALTPKKTSRKAPPRNDSISKNLESTPKPLEKVKTGADFSQLDAQIKALGDFSLDELDIPSPPPEPEQNPVPYNKVETNPLQTELTPLAKRIQSIESQTKPLSPATPQKHETRNSITSPRTPRTPIKREPNPYKNSFVFGLGIVNFHHSRGPELEYWIDDFCLQDKASNEQRLKQINKTWPHLPFQALPDGAHLFDEVFTNFTLVYDDATQTCPELPFEAPQKDATSDPSSGANSNRTSKTQDTLDTNSDVMLKDLWFRNPLC